MARNSSLMKFFFASLVLLFCLAVTSVEGRSVPLLAQLTPEYTGRVNSNNRNYVGQAFVYLANAGNEFHASILVVSNIDPKQITKVQLYNLEDEELIGEKFTKLPEKQGYQVFDKRISYEVGQQIHTERVAVNIYTKEIGNSRPALSGVIVNNHTTFISYLRADQEVTTPTGTSNNDGFASGVAWTADGFNFWLTLVVNHDLDQQVTAIHLHAPAASNTNNAPIITFSTLNNAGKAFNIPINTTVFSWIFSHLGYINIHTTKNPDGALRGQLIPMTQGRVKLPTFPNGATITVGGESSTALPDGGIITGDVGVGLKQGGARNLTGNATDPRVAVFRSNSSNSFDNDFRFALPVTIKNRHVIRSAIGILSVAAEAADAGKYKIGVLNLNDLTVTNFVTVPGNGRRSFSTFQIGLDTSSFPTYLGPGGLFLNIQGTGVAEPLFVDRLYVVYFVASAYANNIVKAIFYKGSSAETEN